MKPSDQPTIQLIKRINQLGAYIQQTTSDKQVFETYWTHIDELCKRIRKYEGIPDPDNE
jgi:hypothetical protein